MQTPRSTLGRTLLAAAVLTMSGCLDAPTVPDAVQQIAGGEAWLAIPEPKGLPTLETWLPYVARDEKGKAARERIDALVAESRGAAYAGDLEWAAELESLAIRHALLSVDRWPEAQVIETGFRAVDRWTDRVESGVDLRVYGDLDASLRRVQRARASAESALEAGDTVAAVVQLSAAAARIRAHAPPRVALRVLGLAESRLRRAAPPALVLERAVHLIRSAREELVSGDPSRALRRALYALQLAEGA